MSEGIIDLTQSDNGVLPANSFELPYSPKSDASIDDATDFCESSELDLPLVKSEPVDTSSSGIVVMSDNCFSDIR